MFRSIGFRVFRVYLDPEVCKIMAFTAGIDEFRAIILHTFEV